MKGLRQVLGYFNAHFKLCSKDDLTYEGIETGLKVFSYPLDSCSKDDLTYEGIETWS